MDRGAWWATGHAVAKSQTKLSDQYFCIIFRINTCHMVHVVKTTVVKLI